MSTVKAQENRRPTIAEPTKPKGEIQTRAFRTEIIPVQPPDTAAGCALNGRY